MVNSTSEVSVTLYWTELTALRSAHRPCNQGYTSTSRRLRLQTYAGLMDLPYIALQAAGRLPRARRDYASSKRHNTSLITPGSLPPKVYARCSYIVQTHNSHKLRNTLSTRMLFKFQFIKLLSLATTCFR